MEMNKFNHKKYMCYTCHALAYSFLKQKIKQNIWYVHMYTMTLNYLNENLSVNDS